MPWKKNKHSLPSDVDLPTPRVLKKNYASSDWKAGFSWEPWKLLCETFESSASGEIWLFLKNDEDCSVLGLNFPSCKCSCSTIFAAASIFEKMESGFFISTEVSSNSTTWIQEDIWKKSLLCLVIIVHWLCAVCFWTDINFPFFENT